MYYTQVELETKLGVDLTTSEYNDIYNIVTNAVHSFCNVQTLEETTITKQYRENNPLVLIGPNPHNITEVNDVAFTSTYEIIDSQVFLEDGTLLEYNAYGFVKIEHQIGYSAGTDLSIIKSCMLDLSKLYYDLYFNGNTTLLKGFTLGDLQKTFDNELLSREVISIWDTLKRYKQITFLS